jgi:hypothetical protein
MLADGMRGAQFRLGTATATATATAFRPHTINIRLYSISGTVRHKLWSVYKLLLLCFWFGRRTRREAADGAVRR